MTFEATPRQCAVDLGRGQCRRLCSAGHITCDAPAHRVREPELLALYHEMVDEQNRDDDRRIARQQALDELLEARTAELAAERARDRERREAAKAAAFARAQTERAAADRAAGGKP